MVPRRVTHLKSRQSKYLQKLILKINYFVTLFNKIIPFNVIVQKAVLILSLIVKYIQEQYFIKNP